LRLPATQPAAHVGPSHARWKDPTSSTKS